jgi:predicted GIY-YIG superfamily endonuclease
VGVTNNMDRRLRQHNGQLSGGAKYTSSTGRQPWHVVCTITGFRGKVEALQFEWALHHAQRTARRSFGSGLPGRWRKLQYVCGKARWTGPAPPASDVPLCISVRCAQHSLDVSKLPPHVTLVHAGGGSNVVSTVNGGSGDDTAVALA